MKTFTVVLGQTVEQLSTYTIDAESAEAAEQLARAGDIEPDSVNENGLDSGIYLVQVSEAEIEEGEE